MALDLCIVIVLKIFCGGVWCMPAALLFFLLSNVGKEWNSIRYLLLFNSLIPYKCMSIMYFKLYSEMI